MIHAVLFAIVFEGLVVVAGCILLLMLMPKNNALATALRYVTDPICAAVATVTPALLPRWSHGVLAILWLLILRVIFYMVMGAYGLLPPVTA
jgi:hypothetical protein